VWGARHKLLALALNATPRLNLPAKRYPKPVKPVAVTAAAAGHEPAPLYTVGLWAKASRLTEPFGTTQKARCLRPHACFFPCLRASDSGCHSVCQTSLPASVILGRLLQLELRR